MKVTVLDTKTGNTASEHGVDSFGWTLGNWACDCNRQLLFGHDAGDGFCIGTKRYIAIKAVGDDGKEYTSNELVSLNEGYPAELLKENGIT